MKYLFYCIIFSVFLLFSACSDGSDTVTGVCYDLKFATTWSNETIPASSFPSNPHFSPLIGATHTQAVTIWKTGSKSSKGIEIMAETGGTSKLRGEISHLGVHDIITGGGDYITWFSNYPLVCNRNGILCYGCIYACPKSRLVCGNLRRKPS